MFNKLNSKYTYKLNYLQTKQGLLSKYLISKLRGQEEISTQVLDSIARCLMELNTVVVGMYNDGKLSDLGASYENAKREVEEILGTSVDEY